MHAMHAIFVLIPADGAQCAPDRHAQGAAGQRAHASAWAPWPLIGPGPWIGAWFMDWGLGHELGARAMNGPECIQTRCRPLRLWLIVQPAMVAGAG